MVPRYPNKTRPPRPGRMPTMSSKKVYSRELKLETLRLLKSSGKTKTELERELGLRSGQLGLRGRHPRQE